MTDPSPSLGVADPSPPPDERRCTAKANRTGERCELWAMQGTTVCQIHGGRAPQVKAAARRRLVQAEAERELAKVEVRAIGDPVVELADVAAQALAMLEWAKARATKEDQPDADVLAVLERAMDRAGRMLEACGRLGLEERRVKLDEARVAIDVALIRGVLVRRGLDPDDPGVQEAIEATMVELGQADE